MSRNDKQIKVIITAHGNLYHIVHRGGMVMTSIFAHPSVEAAALAVAFPDRLDRDQQFVADHSVVHHHNLVRHTLILAPVAESDPKGAADESGIFDPDADKADGGWFVTESHANTLRVLSGPHLSIEAAETARDDLHSATCLCEVTFIRVSPEVSLTPAQPERSIEPAAACVRTVDGWRVTYSPAEGGAPKDPFSLAFQLTRPLSDDEFDQFTSQVEYAYRVAIGGDGLSGFTINDERTTVFVTVDASTSPRTNPSFDWFEESLTSIVSEGTPVRVTDRSGVNTRGTRLIEGLDSVSCTVLYATQGVSTHV